jgi:hypothetical protein
MEQALKDKWIAALRSGKYPQTSQFLRTSKGYCCLGVLCDVAGEQQYTDPLGEYRMMDALVEIKLGLAESTNDLYLTSSSLAAMNDGNKEQGIPPKSFLEIADWIESNL